MAASLEAQGPTLEEVLSHHELKPQDLKRKCTQAMRYEIGIMVVAWKMTGQHFQFPKENLAAKEEKNKAEEERRVALLKTWDEEIERDSSEVTYSKYMARFHHQERYDLMDSLCNMVKISHPEANKSGMKTLSRKFNKLRENLGRNLTSKNLARSLTQLPIELKMESDTTIQDKLPGVKDALRLQGSTNSHLFSELNPLFTFANYSLLNFLISKFGSNQLKADMTSYVHNAEDLMSNTTVHEAISYWPGEKQTPHKNFSRLWIKLTPNDPSIYTLKELDDFRTKLCSKLKLSKILVSFGWLEPSCSSVDAVWLVPTGIIHELIEAVSKVEKTFQKENVKMILLEEELLYLNISAKGGGYVCKFTSNPSECHMCHSTLHDPHTVACCNKNFCKPCIAMVKQNDGQCPQCAENFELHPYEELNEILQSFCSKNKEQQLKAFHCHLCNFILHDPHTVSCCKETFCKSCIMKVKEDHGRCPKCGTLPQDFAHFPSKKFHDVILQFEVYCMNECSWEGVLKEHDVHLNINPPDQTWLEGCGLIQVECIHCKLEIHERSKLLDRLEIEIETHAVYKITCSEVCTKWKNIGLELGLDQTTLDSIALCPQHKTREDCYHDMLKKWSQSKADGTCNYKNLLKTFRSSELKLESPAKNFEKALLCTKSCGLKVDQLTKEIQELKEEYKAQRSRVNDLMDEIEAKNVYLEKKRRQLEKLNFAYSNAKQNSVHVQRNLTEVNDHLRELEQNMASIEKDILDGEKAQKELIRHILEAEDQLKDTKEHMEKCLKSLSEHIEHLKSEKILKLQDCDHRNVPRPQTESQQVILRSRVELSRQTATESVPVQIARIIVFMAQITRAATLRVGPIGILTNAIITTTYRAVRRLRHMHLAGKIADGRKSTLTATSQTKNDEEREHIEPKYKELIEKCIDKIEDMKTVLEECQEKLKKMEEIVRASK